MASYKRLYSTIAVILPLVTIGTEVTLLEPYIDGHIWFLLYPTLFVSSWIGTRRAALLATAVATIGGWWVFVPPRYTWGAEKWGDVIPTLMIAATGTLFALFHDRVRRTAARLKQALDKSQLFSALLANSSDFIGVADTNGRPVWLNPEGRRMIGMPDDYPVETTTIPDYYATEVQPFAMNVIVREMVEKGRWSGETYFRNWRTGESIPVSDTHFLIRDPESGRLLGMGTITRDITQIQRARDAVQELERLRYEWTSIVAHELRQPITAILLKASGLLRQSPSDVQRRDISHMAASAQRLNAMVSDLTDASLLDSKRITLVLGRIELGGLVRDVVDRTPLASERTTVVAPPDTALFVKGDAGRLEQVFGNVLSNAVKYSDPDTEIVVAVTQANHDAEVTVANRGPGIPAADLDAIFDRYVRGLYAAAKGLGLGLHIARGLVEAHGGRIWAESVPGEITTFHIALPLDGPPVHLEALTASGAQHDVQAERP